MDDYNENFIEVTDSQTIILFTVVAEKYNLLINEKMQIILDVMFNSTILIITIEFNRFPDHIYNFFIFLKVIIKNAFNSNYFNWSSVFILRIVIWNYV